MMMNGRIIRTLVLLPAVLLALCSCGLFFLTPFPVNLAQTLATRDFSADIDTTVPDTFRPFVVEKDGTRLILLVGGTPYPGDRPWLFILREDFSLIQSYTMEDLALITNPAPFNAGSAMMDSSGNMVVGNALFGVIGDTVAPLGNTSSLGGLYGRGLPLAPGGENVADFSTSGSPTFLDWRQYDCSWGSPMPYSRQIRSSGPNLWLRDVLADPSPSSPNAIFVLEEEGSNATYFVRVLRVTLNGTLPNLFMEIYPSITKSHIDTSHLGFTSDGIVAFEYETQDWTMFPFNAPTSAQRLHTGNIDDALSSQRMSWSYSGGFSAVYDARSRTLTKMANWWKQ
jgi:hypothetical protein